MTDEQLKAKSNAILDKLEEGGFDLGDWSIEDAHDNGFIDGYKECQKEHEWHYVKDGDLPKEYLRPRTLGYYLTASKHKSYKGFVFEVAYFTGVIFTKGGDILDNVIAWKEIVLPELPKEIE